MSTSESSIVPRPNTASRLRALRHAAREDGSTLVELAVSFGIFATVLLGVMQMSLLLYSYHFVSDAAREASRWAMVRGGNCAADVSIAYCSPASGLATGADNADIQAYVNGLGFPFAQSLTTSTTWYASNGTSPMTWSSCGTAAACKVPGNQVQVTVSYRFPIRIPFWNVTAVPVTSTSTMVIAQ